MNKINFDKFEYKESIVSQNIHNRPTTVKENKRYKKLQVTPNTPNSRTNPLIKTHIRGSVGGGSITSRIGGVETTGGGTATAAAFNVTNGNLQRSQYISAHSTVRSDPEEIMRLSQVIVNDSSSMVSKPV